MTVYRKDVSLAPCLHYRIGGKARYLAEVQSEQEIAAALLWACERDLPFLVVGAGTNMLVSERGYDGLIIRMTGKEIVPEARGVRFSAGTPLADAVDFFTANGFGDLSWAGGLPGTVGGAVFGNAGCFGREMRECVVEVDSLACDGASHTVEPRVRSGSECAFAYRGSLFKCRGEIITSVLIKATPGDAAAARAEAQEHIDYRLRFQPLDFPCAGSTFKNVPLATVSKEVGRVFAGVIKIDPLPVIPAAAILDRLGLKGRRIGGAEISAKHPNFFINRDRASFADITGLIALAKRAAWRCYGIALEEEVQIVN